MQAPQINRLTGKTLVLLSFIALMAVLSGYLQPPQADEGAAAHIFQLSIVTLVPTILVFFATADWTQPLRLLRAPAVTALTLMLAFGALYYLEHSR